MAEVVDEIDRTHSILAQRPLTEFASTKSESESQLQVRRRKEAEAAYGRVKTVKDKKLRGNLKSLESKYKTATLRAKDAEILHENTSGFLEPENDLERTFKVTQEQIKKDVAVQTAKKGWDLKMELGPYVCEYTKNGRELILAGRKGHIATMDSVPKLGCELQLQETIRDVRWLNNNQRFAVAQKKYVYIYDRAGVELHCLRKHIEGNAGYLKYQDITEGKIVAEFPTRSPTSLTQNPSNAILHLGHQNGTVTLWSPSQTTPLVKFLAHRGLVRSLAVHREGTYMVSTGQDLKTFVWDIRMLKENPVNECFTHHPATSVAISDTGLTAVGWGTQVAVYRGLFTSAASDKKFYMKWGGEGNHIERVRWRPFEDILGVSHSSGFSQIIVPGAGEPNFDALEANPYENTKQRHEAEVKALLNKLKPEMISLNPDFIGNLDLKSAEQRKAEQDLDKKPADPLANIKNRGRGKNSSLRKHLRKKGSKNIIDEHKLRIQELRKSQHERDKKRKQASKEELGPALGRFARK
ncbi:hypothetical protein B7494_g2550 [Chlorociboria aeruginascens]|nr:hypothetical protein B7494_g2550 [Chlorociboria aeruginascens]